MFISSRDRLRGDQEARFFATRFFSLDRLSRASFFSNSALDTLRTMLSALLSRSAGVAPGTFGAAGNGFIPLRYYRNPVTAA
jgi:hypothetical protein